jgi:predicted RNA-binding Zn ribbon-like protein
MGMSSPAPEPLETVRAFVNTRDVELGTDALGAPDELGEWLAAKSLLDRSAAVRPADLRRAVALREALRAALEANHASDPIAADAVAVINEVAARARLGLVLDANTGWVARPAADGVDAALGTVVGWVAGAMADGTWRRLKVCVNDTCRWAFYDTSRARVGRWCSMQLCGNRAKQQAWRARHDSRDS